MRYILGMIVMMLSGVAYGYDGESYESRMTDQYNQVNQQNFDRGQYEMQMDMQRQEIESQRQEMDYERQREENRTPVQQFYGDRGVDCAGCE